MPPNLAAIRTALDISRTWSDTFVALTAIEPPDSVNRLWPTGPRDMADFISQIRTTLQPFIVELDRQFSLALPPDATLEEVETALRSRATFLEGDDRDLD